MLAFVFGHTATTPGSTGNRFASAAALEAEVKGNAILIQHQKRTERSIPPRGKVFQQHRFPFSEDGLCLFGRDESLAHHVLHASEFAIGVVAIIG